MSEYFRIQERKAIRIRTLKILALVILVLSSTLFSSFSQAQINGLSSTETANVESALDQLEEIADEFEDLLKDKGARDRLGGDLDALRAAIANLRDLFNDGKIKSVPDLDDESKRKYRHGDDIGSPAGAFCDDKTFVKNDETGEWEQCTEGDILISDNLLNPEDDGPIDPNTQEGWEKLIELSQLLFHEKWHEIMVARQLELLRIQTRQSWDGKTPEQRQALIDGAKRKAATPKAHAEVYSKHKNLLRVYKKILEKKKTEFRKQKYKLRGEARQEIEEQIADLDTKIDWLQNKLKDLEKTKKKAIHSFGFGFQEHGWPEELYDATLGIYVTTPSSYWLLGVMMEELTAVEYYLVEVGYLDEIEHEDEMPSTFTHFMVMGEDTFTALQVRPDVDEYLPWALETDTIVVDGLNGEPLTGSTIQVYSSDNVLVMQEDIDETGPVTALLPVGDYYTTIRMNILGFDVNLKKSRTFSTQNMAGIELNVSLFIIPMRYFQPFTRSIAAVGAGLLSKWGVAKIGRKRLPKIVPWLVGLGVASAVMLPLLF
jgi:hypothetical protein